VALVAHLRTLVVTTMLTPPKGEPTPDRILKPVTYKDYALLGQHLFGRSKTRKAMQESVAACNKAISLASHEMRNEIQIITAGLGLKLWSQSSTDEEIPNSLTCQ